MFLPCQPCCNKCGCPAEQSLPDSVVVQFAGLPEDIAGINGLPVSLPYAGQGAVVCRYQGCVNGWWVTVDYRGANTPPIVTVNFGFTDGGLAGGFRASLAASSSSQPFQCDPFSFTASDKVGITTGSVVVSPATSRVGRCWSLFGENAPQQVFVEISGAVDIASRLKLAPIPGRQGSAAKRVDRLEFLNGKYDFQIAGGAQYGGCQVFIYEHCFAAGFPVCGGSLRLYVPKYAGAAWLEFENSNVPSILVTAVDDDAVPDYPSLPDGLCPPFAENTDLSFRPWPTRGRFVGSQAYGFSRNAWPANGFCNNGIAQLEFANPRVLTNQHTKDNLAFAAGTFPISFYEDAGAVVEYETEGPLVPTTGDPLGFFGPLPIKAAVRIEEDNSNITLTLKFSSCFGSGASGVAQAEDNDPITSVSLTGGGQGYAKLGRRQPTLSILGAAATFTLTQHSLACDIPYWSVASVSVAAGATGFSDYQDVAILASAGDVVELPATGTIRTRRAAPTLTAAAAPGSGAVFSVTLANNNDGTWGVQAVSVTGETAGYQDGAYLTFTTSDTEASPASARIVTGRVEPSVSLSVFGSGSDALLTPTLTSTLNWEGKVVWYVSSISIEDGGSGYATGDYIVATPTDGQSDLYEYFYAEVTGVDEDGAITGIAIYGGGAFFKSNGTIDEVVVEAAGLYYREEIDTITITNGGRYYREDATLAPYVASVSVSVIQPAGSVGAGAVIVASVDSDTSSSSFGEIASLDLIAGGDNYITTRHINNCLPNPFP